MKIKSTLILVLIICLTQISFGQNKLKIEKSENSRLTKVLNNSELIGEDRADFTDVMLICWSRYRMLLEAGYPREIARYVLPNACETRIVMTMNFRELRHFIKLRTSSRALPEMREVAKKIETICKEIAPDVFEDL